MLFIVSYLVESYLTTHNSQTSAGVYCNSRCFNRYMQNCCDPESLIQWKAKNSNSWDTEYQKERYGLSLQVTLTSGVQNLRQVESGRKNKVMWVFVLDTMFSQIWLLDLKIFTFIFVKRKKEKKTLNDLVSFYSTSIRQFSSFHLSWHFVL